MSALQDAEGSWPVALFYGAVTVVVAAVLLVPGTLQFQDFMVITMAVLSGTFALMYQRGLETSYKYGFGVYAGVVIISGFSIDQFHGIIPEFVPWHHRIYHYTFHTKGALAYGATGLVAFLILGALVLWEANQ